MQNIAIIGANLNGLLTAAILNSECKIKILDRDTNIINKLKQKEFIHIEPELSEKLQRPNITYEVSANLDWIVDTDIAFLNIDQVQIIELVDQIRQHKPEMRVIISSIVPIQFCDILATEHEFPTIYFSFDASAGIAVKEIQVKKTFIIGKATAIKQEEVQQLFSQLFGPESDARQYKIVPNRLAILSKLAINEYLALHIGLANELNQICHAVDIDYMQLQSLMSTDFRVCPTYLLPGPGFGGTGLVSICKSLSTQYMELVPKWMETHNKPKGVLATLPEINTAITGCAYYWISQILAKHAEYKIIGILGITYKEGSDSLLESRYLDILKAISSEAVVDRQILVHDAAIEALSDIEGTDVQLDSLEQVVQKSDILIVNHGKYVQALTDVNAKVVIDFTGLVKPETRKELYSWIA